MKALAATAFLAVALLLSFDTTRLIVAAAAAILLAVSAARDVLVPVRLAADERGVTVTVGIAGHRFIPWQLVERLVVDQRRRLGIRNELVEIDTGSDLYLFTGFEVGADPNEVVAELRRLRAAR